MSTALPFTTYDGGAVTYEQAEFLPGYTAHARIIDKDVDTDSHVVTLTLQFGVSETTDPSGFIL
jgi:hypothetical protein